MVDVGLQLDEHLIDRLATVVGIGGYKARLSHHVDVFGYDDQHSP